MGGTTNSFFTALSFLLGRPFAQGPTTRRHHLFSWGIAKSLCPFSCKVSFTTGTYFPPQAASPNLTKVRGLREVNSLLEGVSHSYNSNLPFLEASLRSLSRSSKSQEQKKKLFSDDRFISLLSGIKARLGDADSRMLSMVASSLGNFNLSSAETRELAQNISDVVVRRENTFQPYSIASLIYGLACTGIKDPAVIDFCKIEALKAVPSSKPRDLILMISGFKKWGALNKHTGETLLQKLTDETEQFSCKDVCDALDLFANYQLTRGFLIRRLSSLAFENLKQFPLRSLVSLAFSLARLRFLNVENFSDIMDEVKPQLAELSLTAAHDLLLTISCGNFKEHRAVARKLVDLVHTGETFLGFKSSSTLAYSILYFQFNDCDDILRTRLARIFDGSAAVRQQDRIRLLQEIIVGLQQERKDLGIVIPQEIIAITDEADKKEAFRLETSNIHIEITTILNNMDGKYKLDFQRSTKAGPYHVGFLDEKSKIVIDMARVGSVTNGLMKMRHLEKLGYKPILLPFWDYRRCRSEVEQTSLLKQGLDQYL